MKKNYCNRFIFRSSVQVMTSSSKMIFWGLNEIFTMIAFLDLHILKIPRNQTIYLRSHFLSHLLLSPSLPLIALNANLWTFSSLLNSMWSFIRTTYIKLFVNIYFCFIFSISLKHFSNIQFNQKISNFVILSIMILNMNNS